MDTPNTLNSIPIDLFYEIFSRLPIKTVGICRCVSKTLASRLGSEDFKQLFLTRSLTRPRLLFAVKGNNEWDFYSSPQPQILYLCEKPSLVVTEFSRSRVRKFIYGFGLFYFPIMSISTTKGEEDTSHMICNPSTGQYVILPKLKIDIWSRNFLGFDPIDKQFKLLIMNARMDNGRINVILTLGSGKMSWRTIKCPFLHDYPFRWSNEICINGVLYYVAEDIGGTSYVIVCFDVRTETFKLKPIAIDVQGSSCQLINYKGKLGVTILRKIFHDNGVDVDVELYILVLEEDECSKYFYTLPTINFKHGLSVVGMASTDEIVLSTVFKPFYLYYFNLENNSLQSVEVQGIENHGSEY